MAQTKYIDSIKVLIKNSKEDNNKVELLNETADKLFRVSSFDSSIRYANLALMLAKKINYKPGIAGAYSNLGTANWDLGNYPLSLQNYFAALKIYELLKDKYGIGGVYTGIANVYNFQGNYTNALKNYAISLDNYTSIGFKSGMATAYINIGNSYYFMANYSEALKNFNASIKLREELEKEKEDNTNKVGLANCYENIGNINYIKENYEEALKSYSLALILRKKTGEKRGITSSYRNFGDIYLKEKKYALAIESYQKGLLLANETGSLEDIKELNSNLSKAYEILGDYKKSLAYYKVYIAMRDSLLNEENTKKSVRMEMNYEFDKKEAAAKLEQEKKEAVTAAESKKQRVILLGISGFGLLVLIFAVYAYRSFIQKKKANIEISKQKNLIEEKQKEILDSIYYARRIQQSLMSHESYIFQTLKRLAKSA